MADELIRYGYIRTFIFEPRKFISFQDIGYNLKDNEILTSRITHQCSDDEGIFKNLAPVTQNKYHYTPPHILFRATH